MSNSQESSHPLRRNGEKGREEMRREKERERGWYDKEGRAEI